jgi:neprilysin
MIKGKVLVCGCAQAIEMVEDVREAFAEAVRALEWMDGATRLKTLSKLRAIRNFVGFPAWLLTPDQLDKHYRHVSRSPLLFTLSTSLISYLRS